MYDRLREPKFHLLAFSREQNESRNLKTLVQTEFTGLVDFNGFQLTDHVAKVFGTDRPFNILLRPDNHVGFISAETSLIEVRTYLTEFIGCS